MKQCNSIDLITIISVSCHCSHPAYRSLTKHFSLVQCAYRRHHTSSQYHLAISSLAFPPVSCAVCIQKAPHFLSIPSRHLFFGLPSSLLCSVHPEGTTLPLNTISPSLLWPSLQSLVQCAYRRLHTSSQYHLAISSLAFPPVSCVVCIQKAPHFLSIPSRHLFFGLPSSLLCSVHPEGTTLPLNTISPSLLWPSLQSLVQCAYRRLHTSSQYHLAISSLAFPPVSRCILKCFLGSSIVLHSGY